MNTNIDLNKIKAYFKNMNQKTIMMIAGIIVALPILGFGIYFGFHVLQEKVIKAQDSTPTAVTTVSKGTGSVQVSWSSSDPTDSVIEYGTEPDKLSSIAYSKAGDGQNTGTIDNLKPDTIYYFRIKSGDKVYDNNGALWTFQTQVPKEGVNATDSAQLSEVPVKEPPTPTPSPSPTVDTSVVPTPSASPNSSTCDETDCSKIKTKLGYGCNTQDYAKCIYRTYTPGAPTETPTADELTAAPSSKPTATSGPTSTPAGPTATPTVDPGNCNLNFIQANSCSSWTWDAITNKTKSCADAYTKYFFQCKSTPFTATNDGIWYCNDTTTNPAMTFPCGSAPTPMPGGPVYCRVRAETTEGGGATATDWMYANSTCSSASSSIPACTISYMQANNCRSFIWDLVNSKLPVCVDTFDHYFLQCKSVDFNVSETSGRWFCNTTSVNHYLDLPCYNAPTPADAESIYCRVRSEDKYNGGNGQYGSWAYVNDVCPSSTPTPTPSDTPTNTPTPTP